MMPDAVTRHDSAATRTDRPAAILPFSRSFILLTRLLRFDTFFGVLIRSTNQ